MAESEELRTLPDLQRTSVAKKRQSEDRQASETPAPTEASRESSAERTSESAEESSAGDKEPSCPPKKIKLEDADSYGSTKPAKPPKRIKPKHAESKPIKDEGVPVKTESQADKLQELSEERTRLSITVAKLLESNAELAKSDAKHAEAYTQLAVSFAKLTEQLTKSTEEVRKEVGAEQAEVIAKLESQLQRYKAPDATKVARAREAQAKANELVVREKRLQDRELAVSARIATAKRIEASAKAQATARFGVYDKHRLDVYGTGHMDQLPVAYHKKLTTLFGHKVSAIVAYQYRDQHPRLPDDIPEDPLKSSWKTQPLAHWFAEANDMCNFLSRLPDNCKDQLVQWFLSSMRDTPKDDPDNWLDKADEALEKLMDSIEQAPARRGYQVNLILAGTATRTRPARNLLRERWQLRRFRALRRAEILSAMLAGDMRSKGYRVAKSRARLFADEHDFAEFD
ncbi:hypothetical protein B0A48_14001 [Cryoendolithus antarcticus]|uniref:Uncharacterized protein n=1 Tax=Cryoendolithus antarcticus TaxID=1507870 RepID=A0A1V8SMB0_9PEZI|nr:hypothetical protein B0A48_14001 [Cryoendolithus antarcticus]